MGSSVAVDAREADTELSERRGEREEGMESVAILLPSLYTCACGYKMFFPLSWVVPLPPLHAASVRFMCPKPSHRRTSRGTEARTEAKGHSASVHPSVNSTERRGLIALFLGSHMSAPVRVPIAAGRGWRIYARRGDGGGPQSQSWCI